MITVADIINNLDCELVCGSEYTNRNVTGGYCSDMLSDVMGNAEEGQVWITMQVHKNIVAVTTLKELSAIILVNGNQAANETIKACEEEKIPLISTNMSAFNTAGQLFKLLENGTIPG